MSTNRKRQLSYGFRHDMSVLTGFFVGLVTYPLLEFTHSMAHMAKRLNHIMFGKNRLPGWPLPQLVLIPTFPLLILGAGIIGLLMSPLKVLYYSINRGYELSDILLLPKANINKVKVNIDGEYPPELSNADQFIFNTRTVVAMIAIFAALSLLAGSIIFGVLHGSAAHVTYNIMAYMFSHIKVSLVGASETALIFGFASLATAAATALALVSTLLTNLMHVAGIVLNTADQTFEIGSYDELCKKNEAVATPSFAYEGQEPAFHAAVTSALKAPCQVFSSTSVESVGDAAPQVR